MPDETGTGVSEAGERAIAEALEEGLRLLAHAIRDDNAPSVAEVLKKGFSELTAGIAELSEATTHVADAIREVATVIRDRAPSD